jgi:hypothetical protein
MIGRGLVDLPKPLNGAALYPSYAAVNNSASPLAAVRSNL